MDTTVETAMTICMSCRLERCCTLSPQWWSYITRRPTPKDIILDMLMILNGNQYTCLKELRHSISMSVIQIMSDIRRAICFNTLLIIDILPLVAIWEMPMGTLTYSMRTSLQCLENVARNEWIEWICIYIPHISHSVPRRFTILLEWDRTSAC